MLYIDLKIFHLLNEVTNSCFLPYFFLLISSIFNISNFVFYYFILLTICFFYVKQFQGDKKKHFFKKYLILVEVGTSYALIGLVDAFIKFSINSKRPFCFLNDGDFISILDFTHERCMSGFPSNHISLAFFFVYYIWPYAKNKLHKLCLIVLIILVGISRITLAMHFPWQLLISLLLVYIIIKSSQKICQLLSKPIILPIGDFVYNLLFHK